MGKHRIVITLVVEGDYGMMEANTEFYGSEAITEMLGEVFQSGTDKAWSIMPPHDTVWIEDIVDLDLDEATGKFVRPGEVA